MIKKCNKIFVFFVIGALSLISISFGYTILDGSVLKVDLSKEKLVVVKTAPGKAKSLLDLVNSVGGDAGMNGAYFCPAEPAYKSCGASNDSNFERIVKGKLYGLYGEDTGTRGIVGVTKDNEPLFVQHNYGYVGVYKNNTNKDRFSDIYYGIANFPILLDQGKDVVDQYTEEEIHWKMRAKQAKGFICHTKDRKYMYMGIVPKKTIYEMPGYIKSKYGCWNAINLDSGWSSAVYAKGKYLVGPGRNIVDAYVVVTDKNAKEIENTETVEKGITCSKDGLPKGMLGIIENITKVLSKKSNEKKREIKMILKSFLTKRGLTAERKNLFKYLLCKI